ncbi:MAG: NAD-dependent epimerase/dehydratase family protein [Acidimicrobiales bacterium]
MRVAVTGGAGFIGRHVVAHLVGAGHDVVVLDKVDRLGELPEVSGVVLGGRALGGPVPGDAVLGGPVLGRGPASASPGRVVHERVDILDLAGLRAAMAGCDAVMHLAGVANVDEAYRRPVDTARFNVEGTANVLEAAREAELNRVVLASTVWVYGAVAGADELTEADPVDLALTGHVYTSTKLAAEMLVHNYWSMYHQPYTILRYGVPYGPGMRDELVIARFVRQVLAGETIQIAGDGSQVRNYVYVGDLAAAHVAALGEAGANQVFALDGSEPISVVGIAQTVGELLGRPVRVEHIPGRPGDYQGRSVSTARAREALGWENLTTFAEGLGLYLDWHTARHRS